MPFLLLEKNALTYEDLEVITQTHIPVLSVYEDTGRNREQQQGYPKNIGFIYKQSALEIYVRKHQTFPELNEKVDHVKPEELARKIEFGLREFDLSLIPTIGEWKRRVPRLIKQCYVPYTLFAKKERAEEIAEYLNICKEH